MAREDRSRGFSKYPPPGVDAREPNIARVYDAFLGGKDNFAADRQVVESVVRVSEDAPAVARANRAFLRRVVRYLVGEAGMTQLLDIGSGLPTADNVHQIAQRHHPGARVLYVDHDPAVVTQSQQLLAADQNTLAVAGDLRDPAAVLADPPVAGHLDWTQPVALLMCGILHYVPDGEHPADLTATWYQALAPGSYVFIHHLLASEDPSAAGLQTAMAQALGPVQFRTRPEVEALFGTLELVDPGVVPVPQWHPDADTPSERDQPVLGLACAGLAVVR